MDSDDLDGGLDTWNIRVEVSDAHMCCKLVRKGEISAHTRLQMPGGTVAARNLEDKVVKGSKQWAGESLREFSNARKAELEVLRNFWVVDCNRGRLKPLNYEESDAWIWFRAPESCSGLRGICGLFEGSFAIVIDL